jgi:hypothetical protein
MRECKEALKLAVAERQKYISRVKVIMVFEISEQFHEISRNFAKYCVVIFGKLLRRDF